MVGSRQEPKIGSEIGISGPQRTSLNQAIDTLADFRSRSSISQILRIIASASVSGDPRLQRDADCANASSGRPMSVQVRLQRTIVPTN